MNRPVALLTEDEVATDDVSALQTLRIATRADHEAVDAAFSRFSLATRAGYGDFLTAHARILPVTERLIAPHGLINDWRGRAEALLEDLKELGLDAPQDMDLVLPDGEAARWGALYVLEGSRLGGAVLARRIAPGLPVAFLSAVHRQGGWAALLARLNAADTGSAWRAQAILGAKALFRAYLTAPSRAASPPSAR
ncbi:biliverdin-producing heme oxygenase [Sphingobium sp. DEHP117]|uniref:biliverdin-producing heme oxygenase n=1 Tax=Sphingobium sp. DEHP117 TaxID=2993436 RepID=UPI0027D58157|nr:biliverdin-producing heme oxygenase [Sphingobium sp. DEHP117]MDQ4421394.1 biliverdin-producing heme oxygenase [Sphingobium sp. DEHP117]